MRAFDYIVIIGMALLFLIHWRTLGMVNRVLKKHYPDEEEMR